MFGSLLYHVVGPVFSRSRFDEKSPSARIIRTGNFTTTGWAASIRATGGGLHPFATDSDDRLALAEGANFIIAQKTCPAGFLSDDKGFSAFGSCSFAFFADDRDAVPGGPRHDRLLVARMTGAARQPT
ncbi:hypothetical protein [Sphingomonas sp. R86521]|uniref:hypothetical protein n=1 Tax=Sphingomonas sp. R86521 TaxID=3093860 RepID=UPI0036D3A553